MANPTQVSVGSIAAPGKDLADSFFKAGAMYQNFHDSQRAIADQNMKIDEENRQRGIRSFLADYDPSQAIGKDGFGLDDHTIQALEDSERIQTAEYEQRRRDGTTDETPEEFQQRLNAIRRTHATGEAIKRDVMRQLTARGIGAEQADKIASQYSKGYITQEQLLKEEAERVKALNEELKSKRTFIGQAMNYDASAIANWNSANVRGGDRTSTTYGGGSDPSSPTSGNAKGSGAQYAPMAPETYDLIKERGLPWTNFMMNPLLKGESASIKEMQRGMNAYNAIANNQKPDEQGNMPYITGTVDEYMRFLDEHRGQAALSNQPEMLSKEAVADLMRKDFTRWVQIDRSKRRADGGKGSTKTTVKSSGVDKSDLLEPVRYASEADVRGVKESQVYLADSWDVITRKRVEESYKNFLPVLKAKQASGEWPVRKPANTDTQTNVPPTGKQEEIVVPKEEVLQPPLPPSGIARNEASEATAQARQQEQARTNTLQESKIQYSAEALARMSNEERTKALAGNITNKERLDRALSGSISGNKDADAIKLELDSVDDDTRTQVLQTISSELAKSTHEQYQKLAEADKKDGQSTRLGNDALAVPKRINKEFRERLKSLGATDKEIAELVRTYEVGVSRFMGYVNAERDSASSRAERARTQTREAIQRSILTGDSLQDQNSRIIGNLLDNTGISDIMRSAPPATRENQERITARNTIQAQEQQADLDAYRLQLDQARKEIDRDQALNQQYQGVSFIRGLTGYPDVEVAAGMQELAKQSTKEQLANYASSRIEQGIRKTIQNVPVGADGITERPIELTDEEISTLPKELQVSVVASNITTRDNWRKNTNKHTSLTDVEPMLTEAEDTGVPEVAEAVLDRLNYSSLQEMVNRVTALESQWLNGKIPRERYNTQLSAVEDHLRDTAEKLFPYNVQAQREYYLNFEQLRRGDTRRL